MKEFSQILSLTVARAVAQWQSASPSHRRPRVYPQKKTLSFHPYRPTNKQTKVEVIHADGQQTKLTYSSLQSALNLSEMLSKQT